MNKTKYDRGVITPKGYLRKQIIYSALRDYGVSPKDAQQAIRTLRQRLKVEKMFGQSKYSKMSAKQYAANINYEKYGKTRELMYMNLSSAGELPPGVTKEDFLDDRNWKGDIFTLNGVSYEVDNDYDNGYFLKPIASNTNTNTKVDTLPGTAINILDKQRILQTVFPTSITMGLFKNAITSKSISEMNEPTKQEMIKELVNDAEMTDILKRHLGLATDKAAKAATLLYAEAMSRATPVQMQKVGSGIYKNFQAFFKDVFGTEQANKYLKKLSEIDIDSIFGKK